MTGDKDNSGDGRKVMKKTLTSSFGQVSLNLLEKLLIFPRTAVIQLNSIVLYQFSFFFIYHHNSMKDYIKNEIMHPTFLIFFIGDFRALHFS